MLDHRLDRLVTLERQVSYAEPPPADVRQPYVIVRRPSRVLVSAPHAARCWRNNGRQAWHVEEEYTASLALLLGEICKTSVIAGRWRNDQEDPNWTRELASPYKQAVRRLVQEADVRWLVDLHGMRETRLSPRQRVDLGTRRELQSLPAEELARLDNLLREALGTQSVSHNHFAARAPGRSLTAFAHGDLNIHAVQIEIKQSALITQRRPEAPRYLTEGPYAAAPERVLGLVQALAKFVGGLPA